MDRRKVILIFFVVAMLFCGNIYGQEENSPIENYSPKKYSSPKECLDNFDVEDLGYVEDYNMIDYVQCKSAVKFTIDECNRLKAADYISRCRQGFNTYIFYSDLANASEANTQLVQMCPPSLELNTREKVKQFIEAFIKGNVKFCDTLHDGQEVSRCKAMIARDVNLTNDSKVKDTIYYLKAIKDNDANECKKIKDATSSRICQAFLNRDIKICQSDDNFKKLKEGYCKNFSGGE